MSRKKTSKRALPLLCACLAFLSACSGGFFLSEEEIERRAAAMLEQPWPSPTDDAKLLLRYLERVPDGAARIDVYERLIRISSGVWTAGESENLFEALYAEAIASAGIERTAAYRACNLYLRYNPDGARRWESWERLLNLHEGGPEMNLRILEAMAEEFAEQPERLRSVLLRWAGEEERLRRLTEAAAIWDRLLSLPGAGNGEIADWSARLGHLYFLQRDFPAAEETLALCAERLAPDPAAAVCLYELGAVYRAREMPEEVAGIMRRILDIPGIGEEMRGRVIFDLADALSQMGYYAEARRLFESIRALYPNPLVVETRLRMLEGRQTHKD